MSLKIGLCGRGATGYLSRYALQIIRFGIGERLSKAQQLEMVDARGRPYIIETTIGFSAIEQEHRGVGVIAAALGRPIIHTVVVAHVALAIINAIGRKLRNGLKRTVGGGNLGRGVQALGHLEGYALRGGGLVLHVAAHRNGLVFPRILSRLAIALYLGRQESLGRSKPIVAHRLLILINTRILEAIGRSDRNDQLFYFPTNRNVRFRWGNTYRTTLYGLQPTLCGRAVHSCKRRQHPCKGERQITAFHHETNLTKTLFSFKISS